MWYYYEYRDINGNLVCDQGGGNGTMVKGKMAAYVIKNKERALTALHGVKCIVKFVRTES
jgi:hypothetical protein